MIYWVLRIRTARSNKAAGSNKQVLYSSHYTKRFTISCGACFSDRIAYLGDNKFRCCDCGEEELCHVA